MNRDDIIFDIKNTYIGLVQNTNWGEVGLFYNPEMKLKKGVYVVTFKESDGANDTSSNLDRKDIYRLNIGISKNTFIDLFGYLPQRPKAGGVIDMDYDFTELDVIMPHPVYGWMSWICVLNPSKSTYSKLQLFIAEGYKLALEKYSKRVL